MAFSARNAARAASRGRGRSRHRFLFTIYHFSPYILTCRLVRSRFACFSRLFFTYVFFLLRDLNRYTIPPSPRLDFLSETIGGPRTQSREPYILATRTRRPAARTHRREMRMRERISGRKRDATRYTDPPLAATKRKRLFPS